MPSDKILIKILRTVFVICLLLFLSFILFSCKECPSEPEIDDRITTINLELINTWTTSLTFQVSVVDTSDSWSFGLMRNDSIVIKKTVTGKDTTITDHGLIPNTQYQYQACWLKKGSVKDTSDEIIAITMDTTSHNILWEVDIIGEYPSILHDVVIIDENNIWAVGEIKTDSGTFNAVKWDGNHWQSFNIEAYYGTALVNPELYSIQYIDENNIWVSTGTPEHWNGGEWTIYHLWDMQVLNEDEGGVYTISKLYQSGQYFVGHNGTIVRHNNQSFEKMNSGTDINLVDICGKSSDEIWICGATSGAAEGILLEKSGDSWKTIIKTDMRETGTTAPYDTLFGSIDGIWIPENGDSLWIANGWGVFKYSISTGKFRWVYPRWWTQNDSYGKLLTIRGTANNDVFASGDRGTIVHYNGITWKWYKEFYTPYLRLYAIDIKSNIIVVVGVSPEGKAVIVRGHLNQF